MLTNSATKIVCPTHNKVAICVRPNYYKCCKCLLPFFARHGISTEYNACREIENPYRTRYQKLPRFSESPSFFFAVAEFISNEFKYSMPRIEEMNVFDEFAGLYKSARGKFGAIRGKILLKPNVGIVTLIHEYTHHIAHVDKLKVNDEFSSIHGADFLTVEKMLLESFDTNKENFNV